MNQEQISKLEKSIQNMKDKTSRIYLIVQDTRGNAKASVAYIYNLGMALLNAGYNPIILHEKPDYFGVSTWLGEEYMTTLPHKAIEGQNLEVSPEDLIVIPELYGFVMSQISKLPCGKIVLSQAYDHILETLQPGQTWSQLGFFKCITTSERQQEYLEEIMKNVSYDILKPFISDNFYKGELPAKPIIAVHTREQRDAINMIKAFYIKFPQYRWVTFRDMRGLSVSEFANAMKDCFLSVWIDETSSYGTFPLESMKCGVPIVGKIPNTEPDWLTENGLWTYDTNKLVEILGTFILAWLDGIELTDEVKQKMKDTLLPYDTEITKNNILSIFNSFTNKRVETLSKALENLKKEQE